MDWSTSDIISYNESASEYYKYWSIYDKVLYELCQTYPNHDKIDVVIAKVGIVSRSYATGLERHVKRTELENGIYIAANALFEKHTFVDPLMSQLKTHDQATGLPNLEYLQLSLTVHGKLTSLFKTVTRDCNAITSFISKYLHFHFPMVPIYDERANILIRSKEWYPFSRNKSRSIQGDKEYDENYYNYCCRYYTFISEASMNLKNSTIKLLDNYLLTEHSKLDIVPKFVADV